MFVSRGRRYSRPASPTCRRNSSFLSTTSSPTSPKMAPVNQHKITYLLSIDNWNFATISMCVVRSNYERWCSFGCRLFLFCTFKRLSCLSYFSSGHHCFVILLFLFIASSFPSNSSWHFFLNVTISALKWLMHLFKFFLISKRLNFGHIFLRLNSD